MPKQTTTLSLSAKIKAKGAAKNFAATRDAEVSFGNARLPAGIEGGIAKLDKCHVAAYEKDNKLGKKGDLYFYASGVVVSPDEVNGIPIKGLHTSINIPLCDVPSRQKTFGDQLEIVVNELKKLDLEADKSTPNMSEVGDDGEGIDEAIAAIKEKAPYLRFRTSEGSSTPAPESRNGKWFVGDKGPYPTENAAKTANPFAGKPPMVFENWNGALPDYVPDDGDGGVDDKTGPEEPEEPAEEVVEEAAEETGDSEGEVDLDALGELADAKPSAKVKKSEIVEAQQKLTELSETNGIDATTFDTWVEVAAALQEAQGGAEEPAEEEPEEEPAEEEVGGTPEKGEVVKYKAKGAKKAIDHEIMNVYPKNETVTLKNLDTNKMVVGADKKPVGIKWSNLERD